MPKNIHVTPTMLQMEAVECGAVALAIILAYYGRYVSLPEIRLSCGISRDGSKAINMLKAARQYGLDAQGVSMEDWKTVFELPLPCIIFWRFNHFVVVEGMHGDKIYLNDPAIGRCVVNTNEFGRNFTGIAMMFTPSATFKPGGERSSLLSSIKRRLQGTRITLTYIVLASLALVVPGILIPGFSKIFIDDILIHQTQHWFIPLLVGMAITALLRGLFTWLQRIHLLRLQTALLVTSSLSFMWHLLHLPLNFFTQRYMGDVAERVAANDRIAQILSGDVSASMVSIITMLFFAIVMLLLSWPLGLISIIIVCVNAMLLYYSSHRIADMTYRFLQDRGQLIGLQTHGLRIIETLKANGAENIFFERWAGFHARTINSQQQTAFYALSLQIIPQFFNGLANVIFLGFGGWLIMQGDITIGTLVALQSLFITFQAPLQTLLNVGGELPKMRGDFARIDDVLQHPEDTRYQKKSEQFVKGEITLRQVSFGFVPIEPPFLKNVSLTVSLGQFMAIVGATGSGKSTLAKLMVGLYYPWSGDVEIQLSSLAFVDQDIFLFEGTVRDNLTLWDKSIPEEDMKQALADACLSDVIEERGGLDAHVTENGTNYSGGQRQRLEIARALVKNPAILVLDEATNALDSVVEKQLFLNLKKRNCTIINVAHRLATVSDVDQIIVMDQGQIMQQGNHDELIQQENIYQRLYRGD